MKQILMIIFLVFIGCNKKATQAPENKIDSKNKQEFIELNLPKFDKWKESLKNPSIKTWVERTSIDSLTKYYAVYVSNKTDLNKFETDTTLFQDYVVLYIRKHEQQNKIESEDLNDIFDKQLDILNVQKTSLDSLKYKLDILPTKTFLLVKDYQITSNSKTGIFLMKQDVNNPTRTSVIILNWLNIKNHLFYCSYYLNFENLNSIDVAKENNEIIINDLIKLNK